MRQRLFFLLCLICNIITAHERSQSADIFSHSSTPIKPPLRRTSSVIGLATRRFRSTSPDEFYPPSLAVSVGLRRQDPACINIAALRAHKTS